MDTKQEKKYSEVSQYKQYSKNNKSNKYKNKFLTKGFNPTLNHQYNSGKPQTKNKSQVKNMPPDVNFPCF